MNKKLLTACMAIAAFAAFVLPATASATNKPQLKEGANTVLEGATIVGTNVGETTFTKTNGEGLVHCSNAELTGEVVKNSGGTVEGTIETSEFWGTGNVHSHNSLPECTGDAGNSYVTVVGHMCIRSTGAMATDEFQVFSSSGTCSGLGNVRFIIGSTLAGPCEYEATGAVKGHFTTGAGSQLTVTHTQAGSGAKKIGGSFLCPTSGMLKMAFKLETENGTEVTVSEA